VKGSARTGTIDITDDAAGSPHVVNLSGTSSADAQVLAGNAVVRGGTIR
jgi:hypothetical protein